MSSHSTPPRIAITGGIGSGKSYVCRLLQRRGIDVYDCDAAAKRLMRCSPDLRQQLTQLIGPDTYIGDQLNKAAVAADFIQSGKQWMECAILYESGFDRLVDKVIVVTAPDGVRLQRIMLRDGIPELKARQWIERQWPQEQVRRLADYEIVNDGLLPLLPQIERIITNIQQ